MDLLMILVLVPGPCLVVASFIIKKPAFRIAANLAGISIIVYFTYVFSSIGGLYAQEHPEMENRYHRQIIARLDSLLASGRSEEARDLTGRYLAKTEGSSFMRNDLHKIVESMGGK